MARQQNQGRNRERELGIILDGGLKLLAGKKLKPLGDCPDSLTFVRFVQGQTDPATEKNINSHIAFCDDCYREYLALAEPEDVMKEIEQEISSHKAVGFPDRSPETWRRLMERLKGFVIDLGEKYGKAVLGPVHILAETSTVRGKGTSLKLSKLLETNVGNNTYRIQLGVRRDGSFECGIDGHKITDEVSLRLAVRRDTGEALFLTETNVHGNTNFVLANEKVPRDILVLDLHLDGHESQIAFRMPR